MKKVEVAKFRPKFDITTFIFVSNLHHEKIYKNIKQIMI